MQFKTIEELREAAIKTRDKCLEEGDFKNAVELSHRIAALSQGCYEIDENGKVVEVKEYVPSFQ